jgi:hypothetical protein
VGGGRRVVIVVVVGGVEVVVRLFGGVEEWVGGVAGLTFRLVWLQSSCFASEFG